MEGLLATQARAKKARLLGEALVEQIEELIARGETIRTGAAATAPVNESPGDKKRMSTASLGSLFARLRRKSGFSCTLPVS